MSNRVITSGWDKKMAEVRRVMKEKLPPLIQGAVDEINEKVSKNLAGPTYDPSKPESVAAARPYIGKMPIPRVSARLAQSMRTLKISPILYKIWSDGAAAPHNIYVHFGTRRMKPRKFIEKPVLERRPAIKNRIARLIKLELRRVGLE